MAPIRSGPTGPPSRQNRGPAQLPSYQQPPHPLNAQAQTALHDLPRNHKLDGLKTKLKAANTNLAQAAAEVNDRFQDRNASYERRRRRRLESGSQPNPEEEAALEEMRLQTDEVTNTLDVKVRDVIDACAEVEGVEKALKELGADVSAGKGMKDSTQSTLGASAVGPTRRRRRGAVEDEDSEIEEEAMMEGGGKVENLKRKIAEQRQAYQSESLAARYSQHNDYVGFKKIVHDARHPEADAPPMPRPSTWFPSTSQRNAPNGGSNGPTSDQASSEDDAIEVASERISIKCPITLLPMQEPVSSTKCPHNFEREAILSMINASDLRAAAVEAGGRRGIQQVKAMKCPVCEVLLMASDLQSNPVLVRKIKRIKAALEAEQNDQDSDSDGASSNRKALKPASSQGQGQDITSSPARTMAERIKAERISQAPGALLRDREVSMVPNSQAVVHLGDEEEIEDADEEEVDDEDEE